MFDTSKMTTGEVLEIARDYVLKHNINDVVVATTKGDTALKIAQVIKNSNIVAVTHSTGFLRENHQELPEKTRADLEKMGLKILTSSMPFHSWNDHLAKKGGGMMPTNIIADTLRLFGQGTKVCVEIALMAGDAGMTPHDTPILSVAGTGRGADTVILLKGACSRRFFNLKVIEVIAKPKQW